MPLLPWARLLRVPNVFTAFADIAMGLCATYALSPRSVDEHFYWRAALLVLASGALYMAGMVWNDYFDLEEDKRDRPFRPVAGGLIRLRSCVIAGIVLIALGVSAASATGQKGMILGGALALAILAYDARLKRTPFGPISMASCRFLNVLLGLSLANVNSIPTNLRLHLAGCIGLYIVGVTWFARTEEKRSNPKVLGQAGLVMFAAIMLALGIPARLPQGTTPVWFPYAVALFIVWLAVGVLPAIRQPLPGKVQAAVKRSIFGLVVFDAVLASAMIGWPGLLIIGLLFPGLLLGRWVYST